MTNPSKDAKKNCKLEDCEYNRTKNDQEEKEIKTVDLCNDPVCPRVAEKKLVDMSHGLSQLERILQAMTGLCKEPKCPTATSDSIRKKIEESLPPMPQPKGNYNIDKYLPGGPIQSKTCKGVVCNNAYMGYKTEEPKVFCGSISCIPKPKPPKPCCAALTCPFSEKNLTVDNSDIENKKALSTEFKAPQKLSGDYKSPYGLPEATSPLSIPCSIQTCPLPTQAQPQTNKAAVGRTSYPYASQRFEELKPNTPVNYGDSGRKSICENATCPHAHPSEPAGSSQATCGNPSCPHSKLLGAAGQAPCGNASCPYSEPIGLGLAPCGNASCPYSEPVGLGLAPCGNVSCPYSKPEEPPLVGLCGRTSCPFASITPNVKPRTIFDPVGLCGNTECPMISKTSPGSLKPCPFADKIKHYPCGSPSCTYVNPSGMLHTHEYGTDLNYVREAARPYCGSASPYDYMSSITPTYPTPLTINYPLFPYTMPPATTPCPFMPKTPNKSCGKPTCPYSQKNFKQKDDFCIESTCPFGEGICGGPRRYSCDSPKVEHCGSPDCAAPLPNQKKGKGSCCCKGCMKEDDEAESSRQSSKKKKKRRNTCCRMSDVVTEIDNCNDPSCLYTKPKDNSCESPTCPLAKKKGRRHSRLSDAYDYYEDYEEGESKPKYDKCTSKTCPYLKKLVFCDGCGGILPDETSSSSEETTVVGSVEGEVGSVVGETVKSAPELVNKKDISKLKNIEPVESPINDQKEVKEVKLEPEVPLPTKTASIYSYPGVQIGHKYCHYWRHKRIPRNMGWLWNGVPSMERHPEHWIGYKPGCILKSVYKKIKQHHRLMGIGESAKKKKVPRSRQMMLKDLQHCLEVKKRDGGYMITVNPVKDPQTRDPLDNPYMDCTPIQFKVDKEKKEVDPVYCPCDEVSDPPPSVDSSEFEFHFTPPAAIPRTVVKRQKITTAAFCQYDCMDLPLELRKSCKSLGKKSGKSKKGKKGKKGKKKGKKKKK